MSTEGCRQIRTKKYNIRIGDLGNIDGFPAMMIKRNGLNDVFTFRELIIMLYGEHSHCIVYNDKETLLKF